MGTRGLFGVVVDGQEKLSYNHFDSYPSGLGKDFLKDLMGLTDQPEKFLRQARDLRLVSEQAKPTAAEVTRLSQYANTSVGNQGMTNTVVHDYYQLLRGLQGNLAGTLEVGVMIDSRKFAYDSLFCEWAYVADLDAGAFEVYRGFQKSHPTAGRWAAPARKAAMTRQIKGEKSYRSDPYYAINCIARFDLAALPTEAELLGIEEAVYNVENELESAS